MMFIPLAQPEIIAEDIKAVNGVLKSTLLSRGPIVEAFESEFRQVVKTRFACAVSSGSSGLIMALQALNVEKDDEVITVSFTVPATVNSIVAVGAIPVMVDIDAETLGMCPEALLAAITHKTRAIIVVHAFGKAAKILDLITIAKEYHVPVIEDACEAIGNCYQGQALGSFADIGVFAFYPNKQITTGEGGMLVTNNPNVHNRFELLRNHGRSMNGDLYDQVSFGWNFRMSDINAALGLSQLKRIKTLVQKRQEIAGIYKRYLANSGNIIIPEFDLNESNSAWFVFVVQLTACDRDEVLHKMALDTIQCGRYFAPVHLQPYYLKKSLQLTLENTENIAKQCLALPFYTGLKQENVKYICDRLFKHTK
jgi:perosamine synthetase